MNEPKLRSGYSSSDQSALQSLSDLNQHVQNKIKLTIKEDKNNNLLRQSNGVPSSSIQQQQQQQDEFPREQLHQIRKQIKRMKMNMKEVREKIASRMKVHKNSITSVSFYNDSLYIILLQLCTLWEVIQKKVCLESWK